MGGKVFSIGGWGPKDEPAFIFKTSDQNFDFLKEEQGFLTQTNLGLRKQIHCP